MSEKTYVVHINSENFDMIVLKNKKLVIVDFWAEWCNPCKVFAPILEKIAIKYKDSILVAKMNIDHCATLVKKYEIQSIPTTLLFHNKKIISRHVGVVSYTELKKILNMYFSDSCLSN